MIVGMCRETVNVTRKILERSALEAKPSLFATICMCAHLQQELTVFQTICESHLHETDRWTIWFDSLAHDLFTVSNVFDESC